MIINILGHGFQWMNGYNQNPAPFNVNANTSIRLYIHINGLYGAENTPIIIHDEREGNMNHIVEHFEDENACPELLLIKDGGNWIDVIADGQYQYQQGFQLLNVNGHRVKTRGILYQGDPVPREFALSLDEENKIFSLSWLSANIRAIMNQRATMANEAPPNEAEEIILRWLVCRQELNANNPDEIPEELNILMGEPNRFNELIR